MLYFGPINILGYWLSLYRLSKYRSQLVIFLSLSIYNKEVFFFWEKLKELLYLKPLKFVFHHLIYLFLVRIDSLILECGYFNLKVLYYSLFRLLLAIVHVIRKKVKYVKSSSVTNLLWIEELFDHTYRNPLDPLVIYQIFDFRLM